jgi:Flp pilus assembly protein TadB
MNGQISLATLSLIIGAVGVIALAVAFLYYYSRTGGQKAQAQALEDYKALAESRKAKNEELESEKADLAARLKDSEHERAKAIKASNDCAQETLRLLARIRRMETAVNDMQRALGRPLTNFDEPSFYTEPLDRSEH